MDWRFDDKISVLSNIYGFIYFFMAKELLDALEDEGAACVREALVKYGHFRGGLLRSEHLRKGYPINVKSFSEHYDLPKDERSHAKRTKLTDDESYSEYYTCQFSDIWKLLEGVAPDGETKVGRIYCETFHQAMWEGYCPNLSVQMDKILTVGDPLCTFHTRLTGGNADIALPKEADAMDWRFDDPISVLQNIYGFLFFFLCKEACDRFGDEGEALMRRAITKYGHFRGGLLAEEHRRQGLDIHVKNFFEHYDLPTDKRTTRHRPLLNETEARSENYTCQFSDMWKLLEGVPQDGGCSRMGRIYCEAFHPAMWEGYCPDMKLELTKILAVGDDRCAFHTYIERPTGAQGGSHV